MDITGGNGNALEVCHPFFPSRPNLGPGEPNLSQLELIEEWGIDVCECVRVTLVPCVPCS